MSVYDDINDKWGYFYTLLQECLNKFLPLKVTSRKSKRPTPWFNDDILQQIRLKNKAKRTFERSRQEEDKIMYKIHKNKLKTTIREAKINSLTSLMSKAKVCPQLAAHLWSKVNFIIGRQKCVNGATPQLSLDSINDHFQNVAVSGEHQPASCYVLPSGSEINNDDCFLFDELPVSVVLSHLNTLDVTKSTGPDGLSARFLKAISNEIAEPLTQLYNDSLRSGVIPSDWKRSQITPVHKGGAEDDPTNYRPIAVVSIIAKILEKIVATQLSNYLESNGLLHPHQGAYRYGKSTEDILLVAVDSIVTCLDKGDVVCAAFLDIRKAFDSLDHCVLLRRLSDLGMSCVALHWFRDYLTDRYHRVKCQGQFSSWRNMKGGIPQGSALGPLLFLVYMNTLPSVVTAGTLLQYADDTTLICSGANPASTAVIMNYQLQLVHSWIADSKMRLNGNKSCVMWFKPRHCRNYRLVEQPDIMINNMTLQVTVKQKYLGLIFDKQLSWTSHVSHICKKMSYYLYLVGLHKRILPVSLIKLLMDSLVLPHMQYALPVWGPSLYQQHLLRLQRLQNRAVRLIFSLHKFDHVSNYYKQLQWFNLDQLIQFRLACMMFHQYHHSRSILLKPPIQFGNHTSHFTRTQPHFANPYRCRLSQTQKFFRCTGTTNWNNLPLNLKQTESFSEFYKAAKYHFLNS